MWSCPFLLVDEAVHFSLIKARASSAGHTTFEVEHTVLKAHLQIRLFEAGISLSQPNSKVIFDSIF